MADPYRLFVRATSTMSSGDSREWLETKESEYASAGINGVIILDEGNAWIEIEGGSSAMDSEKAALEADTGLTNYKELFWGQDSSLFSVFRTFYGA